MGGEQWMSVPELVMQGEGVMYGLAIKATRESYESHDGEIMFLWGYGNEDVLRVFWDDENEVQMAVESYVQNEEEDFELTGTRQTNSSDILWMQAVVKDLDDLSDEDRKLINAACNKEGKRIDAELEQIQQQLRGAVDDIFQATVMQPNRGELE